MVGEKVVKVGKDKRDIRPVGPELLVRDVDERFVFDG